MTVTANTTRNDYTAGSAQSVYNYTFQLNEAADVDVYLDGVKQTLNTHYTVQNVGNASGGTITFTLVDANNNPIHPTQGAVINIVMAMDLDRDTNYQPSGAFLAADVNNDFDRLWLATNQQQTAVNRSLRLQDDDVTTSSMELPLKDARKGKLLAFNATTGDPEATSNNQSNWDTAYNNSITSASFSGSTLTLGQQDGGTITASHTPYLPIAGGTLTGDLNLGFNDLTVGNLTIENLPANATQIVETGTGNFIIKATNLFLQDANNEKYIDCTSNGDVKLYHNNSQKLATTASGISVTGTLSATGYNSGNWDTAYGWGDHSTAGYLTSYTETDPVFNAHVASGITSTNITNWNDAYNNKITAVNFSNSTLTLTQQDGGTLTTTINGGGGASQWTTSGSNIYYNTGNVGIGTSSPANKLHVQRNGTAVSGLDGSTVATFQSTGATGSSSYVNILAGSTGSTGQAVVAFGDADDADIGSIKYRNGDNSMAFTTNNSEAMRIASNGNVGIGTISPDAKIEIVGNGTTVKVSNSAVSSTNTAIQLGGYAASNNSAYGAHIRAYHNFGVGGASSLVFETSGTQERMRIDSSGNVGIGTTSPSEALEVNGKVKADTHFTSSDGNVTLSTSGNGGTVYLRPNGVTTTTGQVIVNTSGNVGIGTASPAQPLHIVSATDTPAIFESTDFNSRIEIKDSSGSSFVENRGGILNLKADTANSADNSRIEFSVDNSEKMRIDSSGNLLVGKTATASTTVGAEIRPEGRIFGTTDGQFPLLLNRKTSDGDIAVFRKDGSTVGAIGTASTDLYLGSGVAGLRFREGGPQLMPWNTTTNSANDNAIDIGKSDARFKDLYLSGGVKGNNLTFSGDGSSEHARIDASGNVGIGTSSPQAILHPATSGQEVARFESTGTLPAYISFKNNGTSALTALGSVDNDLAIYTGTAEQMRINSTGNVGIGTASPSQKLDVNGTAKATTILSGNGTASAPAIAFFNDTDTGMFRPFPDTLAFSEGGVERMRINSAGNVGVGTTSISAKLHVNGNILATSNLSCSAGGVISSAGFMNNPAFAIKSWTSTSTTFYPMLDFRTSGNTIVGSIKSNNTTTQYNTSSDERLKENIRNAEDAGAKIDAIQIRQFDWKEGGEHQDYGVIAQELKEVAPEAVSEGYTEDDMWSVDYSKLVPTLIKEIQSLRNRVAELENN